MRRGRVGIVAAVLALAVAAGAPAATGSWASRADGVCTAWKVKAKVLLTPPPPQTLQEEYSWSVRAVGLERGELAALSKLPGVTPAGRRALASVRTDIDEIVVGLDDGKAGNRAGFGRVYIRWQTDYRPHAAFLKAGVKTCA